MEPRWIILVDELQIALRCTLAQFALARIATAAEFAVGRVANFVVAILFEEHQMSINLQSSSYKIALSYDDIEVGNVWHSPARIVTADDVREFAELTGDHDPLHFDEGFARETPYRQPIAHGLLGLSFVAGLSSEYPRMDTLAFSEICEWKFLKPIFIGDEVYVETEVHEKSSTSRRHGTVIWHRRLINQAGEVVQKGKLCTLVRKRPEAETPGVKTAK